MKLLEREAVLAQLEAQLEGAIQGAGRLVFVEGEAGIGKSSVLRDLAHRQLETQPVYWGHCEALATPRPLGVLDDIFGQAGVTLPPETPRHRQFVAFLDLMTERAALVVLEDVHWADGATLDLLRHAGRRMPRTRSLLVASFRNDELGPGHPLRGVLGDLATTGALRLAPAPLSVDAVRALCADRRQDADELHRITGGNPFFVTEVLSAGETAASVLPATISDAVLARAARLSPAARAILDRAAVAGPRVESGLLSADRTAVAECLATGVLRVEGGTFCFRHELARLAILQELAPTDRAPLHRQCLQALEGSASPARLVHHALGAGEQEALRRLAPQAAEEAARRGAHREAAAHWRVVAGAALDPATRAEALDQQALHGQMCGELDDAIVARRQASVLWRAAAHPARAAATLARLALLHVLAGRGADAEVALAQAQAALPPEDDSGAGFVVRRAEAGLRMLNQDSAEAIRLIRPVLADAERSRNLPSCVHALVTLGCAQLAGNDVAAGMEALARAAQVAEASGDDQLLGLALANWGSGCAEMLHFPQAEAVLQRGIAFCGERDLDAQRLYQLAWLAHVRLAQGRWDDAEAAATDVLAERRAAPIAVIMALVAQGRLQARRGGNPWPALDRALQLATGTAALQRLAPVHAARAEAALLEGRSDDAAREAEPALALALSKRHARHVAELALWHGRAGRPVPLPDYAAAELHAAEARGDWRGAASQWGALGAPYDQARCLANGDETAQRQALALLQSLGARPLADQVARQLRSAGATRLPRGPRAATQSNPAGLSGKEIAVLALLAGGLRSKDIAARLSRSHRTVDHHLQAIFAKLKVSTRAEAVSAAHRLGIVGTPPSTSSS